ncbi:3000_t:CDS:1, partial [Funneliformis caledonium]
IDTPTYLLHLTPITNYHNGITSKVDHVLSMSTITHTFYLYFAVPIFRRKEHQFISTLQRATIELRPAV